MTTASTTASAPAASLPSSGRAIVKCVLSGDTVILRGKPVNGPPPEKTLSLANLIAPRLGTPSDPTKEEPGAFQSREFLRKLLVGKEVAYKIEYTTTTNNRDFGSLSLQPPGVEGETSVAKLLVKGGWVKVKQSEGKRAPSDEQVMLGELEAAAQVGQLGIWSPTNKARNMSYQPLADARAFVDEHKGNPVPAIVEQVRDGSNFRVALMLPGNNGDKFYQYVNLSLTGIKAPAYRQGVPNVEDLIEPYGEEAKYFVETRLLQREVKVLIEGATQNGGLMGTLLHPNGNISEALLAEGLATIVTWNIANVTGGPAKLRAAEQKGKDKKVRLWKNFVAKKSGPTKEFDAIVTRIFGPDSFTVVPAANPNGPERKIFLSSIRAPKQKDAKEAYYYQEAKEFLRHRLIGKTVHVTIDYVKPADQGFEERECATVINGSQNVAEALLSKGLAGVVRHRKDDDNRSSKYDDLLLAEDRALKAQKGMHSAKEPPAVRPANDASESAAKAKQFLPFMQRTGTTAGVVEYAASGSRFKVWIPSQNAKITLVLGGVRTPKNARNPGETGEPFGEEALAFANRKVLQRDVEVSIEGVDKVGGFIGNLFLVSQGAPRVNYAVSLLEAGLASVHDYSASQSSYAKDLYAAEKSAQDKKAGIWSIRDPLAEALAKEAAISTTDDDGKIDESMEVYVSEIGNAGSLYIQVVSSELNRLETLMSDFADFHAQKSAQPIAPYTPKAGDYVSAKFSADDAWYRARVKKVAENKTYHVIFIDYGNSETVPSSRIRPLDAKFSVMNLAAQAKEARLAYVTVPDLDADWGDVAYEKIRDDTEGRKLVASIVGRNQSTESSGTVMQVVLSPSTTKRPDASLNYGLVAEGLATLDRNVEKRFNAKTKGITIEKGTKNEVIASLLEAQELARKQRNGLWRYGDFMGDDTL
ncbi:hypothetical protein HDV05_006962 [Chytridiales sp. JEL 0842]|nr:hypothetical protein HDV05_006962 [Chytridiales sp. JEL 0842]